MNVQDQKLEARIAELEERLSAVNAINKLAAISTDIADLKAEACSIFRNQQKSTLTVATDLLRLISTFVDATLAQIDPPQEPSAEPATDYREIGREMAENRYANLVHAANRGVRCREALEVARKALRFVRESIEDIGANTDDMTARKVCLDTHQVIAKALSEINDPPAKPKQLLPGEDHPFTVCRCPACVTIRAKVRSSNEL